MISAQIIADSVNPVGNRLTTFILEYPRFVHAEFMTHRMFSKNAASSRAIPIEKMIQQVIDNPAMPVWWGKNQSGMQAAEELSDVPSCSVPSRENFGSETISPKELAKRMWLDARDEAIERVREMNKLGLHKQIANRILEPWFNIKIICSMTEIENFFALRAHKDAQPEIRTLAEAMLKVYNESTPNQLKAGEWHIPFGDNMKDPKIWQVLYDQFGRERFESGASNPVPQQEFAQAYWETKRKIAVARCARISYLNFEGKDDYAADVKLCDRLFGSNPKHLSPTEHVAQAMHTNAWSGNFKGFKQYRKFFQDENLEDARVVSKVI